MPEISVVLPTYNRAGAIGRAIDSVLRQDFADFELLVVDDGSTDDTAGAVAAYDDARVVYVDQGRNMGGNVARNRGIREARGAIVCFIDSDDAFLPHKLSSVKAFFDTHGDIDALIDSFEYAKEARGRVTIKRRLNPDLADSAEIERMIFARRIYKATPAISARKPALFEAGLFDETLKRRQDMDMALRLARHCRCAATSAVLWRKHWTEDAISATRRTYVDAVIAICERHPDYLRRPEYRVGLERDLARHCLRQLRYGAIADLAGDLRRAAGYFGRARTARLLVAGLAALVRRSVETPGTGVRPAAERNTPAAPATTDGGRPLR